MAIKKRKIKLMLHKALHLPMGRDFLRYSTNRIAYSIRRRQFNPVVAHPTSLMIELTNHCQLKCKICAREHEWGKQMDLGHMDYHLFKQLVDNNHVYLDRIGLTGMGETLLYPKIIEAVNYIHSMNKGILLFISTNACQANAPELVRELSGKIDTLQISIDGIGTNYEEIRKRANFDKYFTNLEKISKLKNKGRMNIKLNMVVFRDNFRDMTKIVELTKDLDVKEIYFNTVNLVSNDLDLEEYKLYSSEEFKEELNKAVEKAKKYGIYLGYTDGSSLKGFRYCCFPWDNFYVTWDGYVVPCCAKPFPKIKNFGNVFEKGLMPVLNSEGFQEFRRMSKENITPEFCNRCHFIL